MTFFRKKREFRELTVMLYITVTVVFPPFANGTITAISYPPQRVTYHLRLRSITAHTMNIRQYNQVSRIWCNDVGYAFTSIHILHKHIAVGMIRLWRDMWFFPRLVASQSETVHGAVCSVLCD